MHEGSVSSLRYYVLGKSKILVNCSKCPLHKDEFTARNQLQLENTKVDGSVAAHEFLLHRALNLMLIDVQSQLQQGFVVKNAIVGDTAASRNDSEGRLQGIEF